MRGHSHNNIEIFLKMFKWNRHFEEVGKPNFFENLGKYREKILILANIKPVWNYFDERS